MLILLQLFFHLFALQYSNMNMNWSKEFFASLYEWLSQRIMDLELWAKYYYFVLLAI